MQTLVVFFFNLAQEKGVLLPLVLLQLCSRAGQRSRGVLLPSLSICAHFLVSKNLPRRERREASCHPPFSLSRAPGWCSWAILQQPAWPPKGWLVAFGDSRHNGWQQLSAERASSFINGELLHSHLSELATESGAAAFSRPRVAPSPTAGSAHGHGAQHSRYSWAPHQQQRLHLALGPPRALGSQNGKCPKTHRGGRHIDVPQTSPAPPEKGVWGLFPPVAFLKSCCLPEAPCSRRSAASHREQVLEMPAGILD